MKYAIIAAGEGSRLASEGVEAPKPLVEVCGEKLIDRLVRMFVEAGAEEICAICNGLRPEVAAHLGRMAGYTDVPLKYVVETTPSSMHSLYALSKEIGTEPFILTTVDTVFSGAALEGYAAEFEKAARSGACLMGVTRFVDDEKPLYVDADESGAVRGFHDGGGPWPYVSGGIYGLVPGAMGVLSQCIARGESRMRNFQRAIVAAGIPVRAYDMGKVMDIDHAGDIAKAEEFIKTAGC